MQQFIKNMMPHRGWLVWACVGGAFASYLLLVVAGTAALLRHESTGRLAQQAATTAAGEQPHTSVAPRARSLRAVARLD